MHGKTSWINATSLTLGFAFFYLPLLILVVFSFNDGRLVTVWTGFSLRWYAEVLQNDEMLEAAWNTVRIAALSSTMAVILGSFAAITLVRMGRFWGRTLFAGMIFAPLVMPVVITGLSLLLLFVALDIQRGFWTIVIAHTTFNLALSAVVIASRLVSFDRSLEEAAYDLGASSFATFTQVTLPIISPAVVSAWLLSFTYSMDDLVIAAFTAGPGSTTLPMKLYSSVRLGVSPEINALSTILISVVALGICIAAYVDFRRDKNT
ncbi:ABC transporter permease [uncultured Ruegeria sp.]|uniref:ABC transporter permease n=1 Tax=uncultured Ruegeria sp. TaxID=259304 RepID=UPI00263895D5|nr:ABC transporter permease [uncultured Ruegeria sp.]